MPSSRPVIYTSRQFFFSAERDVWELVPAPEALRILEFSEDVSTWSSDLEWCHCRLQGTADYIGLFLPLVKQFLPIQKVREV